MAHTFCPLPWMHLATQANGDLRVCCQCITPPFGRALKPDGSPYRASGDDFQAARNAEVFKEIRRQMLKGEQPSACQLCWQEEKLGKISRRLNELQREPQEEERARRHTREDGTIDTEIFPVTNFDLRLGNHCNLKCRSCSPRDSSGWYDDYIKLHQMGGFLKRWSLPVIDARYRFVRSASGSWTIDSQDFSWYEDSRLLDQIIERPAAIKNLYFTGGEPTLIKAHWMLLQRLIDSGHASNICLDYNTNVSAIRDEHLAIWSKFKKVFLGCSIDAIGERATYLRPPVEWSVIENNLKKISQAGPNVIGVLSVTVSVYNVLHYTEILQYLWDRQFANFDFLPKGQILEQPSWMSIQILPAQAKELVWEKYQSFLASLIGKLPGDQLKQVEDQLQFIVSTMDEKDERQRVRDFYRMTEQLDKIREQDFYETFPEVHELLQMG